MDLSIFTALWDQVVNSPASLMVIIGISVIAYVLEIWPNFNSKWIPIVCVILGPVAYPLFSSASSVPATYPHPIAVLIVNGLVAGLIASILHAKLVLWIMSKLGGKTEPQEPKSNEQTKV